MAMTSWTLNTIAIDRARIVRGWTKIELARRAHVDPKTLTDLLAARRRPTFGTIQAICTALGLELARVIAFVDERCDRQADAGEPDEHW
jgi:transcriptional regulator with XRE-family HTH domain